METAFRTKNRDIPNPVGICDRCQRWATERIQDLRFTTVPVVIWGATSLTGRRQSSVGNGLITTDIQPCTVGQYITTL